MQTAGAGILRLPPDVRGADNNGAPAHPPGQAVAGPDLARGGIPLVDEGVEHIHRAVRREGAEAARGVPGVLLLPDARLAHTAVLKNG